MPITVSSLADGQLPAAKGTLYTVPASTTALITMTFVNTGVTTRSINVYIKRSASVSRRIVPKDLDLESGDALYLEHEGRPYSLSAGDVIEGDATAANEVDYTIDGVLST